MNQGLTKTYEAGAVIAPRLIVTFSALIPGAVVPAAAATDAIIGVSTDVGAALGERVDVMHSGIAAVKAGAAFSAGDLITADAAGKAVKAAPGATASDRILGVALDAATAADEIVDVLIQLGSVSNALNA